MRPKKHRTTGSGDLFRARLDQISNMKHELVQLAGKVDWEWIDGEIAPLYSENGRPGIATRFMIGLLLLKHIYGLSDEGCASVGSTTHISSTSPAKEFFQHAFPHERSDLSHWRKRLGDSWSRCWPRACGWRTRPVRYAARTSSGSRSTLRAAEGHHLRDRCQAAARGHQGAQPTGEEARGQAAAVLSPHCQDRGNDGGALRPCQAIQAASAAVAHSAQPAGPDTNKPPGARRLLVTKEALTPNSKCGCFALPMHSTSGAWKG